MIILRAQLTYSITFKTDWAKSLRSPYFKDLQLFGTRLYYSSGNLPVKNLNAFIKPV